MSTRWPGGIISKTAPVPSGALATSAASGVWTMEQQAYWQKQGLWPIPGNFPPNVEDVFSTYLYTGNGATQTITNGIDLAGEGGLVWQKARTSAPVTDHRLATKSDGIYFGDSLVSNSTAALVGAGASDFLSTGFVTGTDSERWNNIGTLYCTWTFRKAPKFFDVVTYTGNGVAGRTVAHNLGSVPGMMIVKSTNDSGAWQVYHRSLANTQYMVLNTTATANAAATRWNNTTPTSSVFSLGTDATVNASGLTYVAYLFAHDAGGFGFLGNENVISCGSYTGTGASGLTVNLGYEPQYLLIKRANDVSTDWILYDVMRGLNVAGGNGVLYPNISAVESVATDVTVYPTATGFQIDGISNGYNISGGTFIYMAIRRGPMATPTLGTQVFSPVTYSGSSVSSGSVINAGFPVDLYINKLSSGDQRTTWVDRLRGDNPSLFPQLTQAEESYTTIWGKLDQQLGIRLQSGMHDDGQSYSNLSLRRAPGFFDVVCYTGTGVARTVNHNLTVAPELMIVKSRGAGSWNVYSAFLGNTKRLALNLNFAETSLSPTTLWNSTTPTSSVFSLDGGTLNNSDVTYVAYLFASDPGVSKVGSYTGTGTTQAINCGFTTGARFVLIKRTDSTGDWFYWDSARGIVAGNDPYLLLNSTAAEVTNTDYVDTAATGFEISSTAPAAINANGGSYIFLAIA